MNFSSPDSAVLGIGPPPPDNPNPLDRLAKPRPRGPPLMLPQFPMAIPPPFHKPRQDLMSLNFAPPVRSNVTPHNPHDSNISESLMKDSHETSRIMSEQDNVVVTDVIKHEEGEEGVVSDDDIPPPPPPQVPAAGDHSEEGECDSESEDGELGEEAKRRDGRYRDSRNRNRDGRNRHSPRENVIALVKNKPGAPIPQLDPVQRRLERIASGLSGNSPTHYREHRDRGYREREEDKRNNGAPEDRCRPPPREYNRDKYPRDHRRSMRPGDMPSLIPLPAMPVITSSAKGKVPDFPPLQFGAAGLMGSLPPPIPPPMMGLGAWPPAPIPPMVPPGRYDRGRDERKDNAMQVNFDRYNKAWESYYSGMGKDRPKDKERRSPEGKAKDYDRGYSSNVPSSGMPPFPPGMVPPGMMPPGMMGSRSKESAWERGLKVSKRIREEVKRNEKSDEESEDSAPGTKLQSKIVLKEHCKKSRSPGTPKGKSTRRLSPLSDTGSFHHHHPQHHHPERYRGAYERKPEDTRKKPVYPGGEAAWHDPWMRPNSPKDRKRQISKSSSSSDSSSDEDSPQRRRLKELKRQVALADRKRRLKKDAAKMKKLRDKLSPSEFEMLTRKRFKNMPDNSRAKYESNSDSDSDDSSSSSSSGGSGSPGAYNPGKLADSPTSPLSSDEFNYKDKKKTREILMKQLQKVEKQLERKKKDETQKRRHS